MKGKFIVFEGADGSGKTTQAKLLFKYLKKNKIPAAYISFPRYTQSVWGQMVRRYLNGDFGKIDAHLASMLYAGDRFSAAKLIRSWLDGDKIVVCDRYVPSSIAHQGARVESKTGREKLIKWLEHLEYKENGIPEEDLVFFLDVPIEFSLMLMRGRKLDIHEADKKHLKAAFAIYSAFAKKRRNWKTIKAVEKRKLLSIDEVHQRILGVLKKNKVI